MVFVPTPEAVVDRMLRMAKVGPTDVVYDLGCGDGRIVRRCPRLRRPGSQSVDKGDWRPVAEAKVEGRPIYLWTIPARR